MLFGQPQPPFHRQTAAMPAPTPLLLTFQLIVEQMVGFGVPWIVNQCRRAGPWRC